jgi:hypothetical protein
MPFNHPEERSSNLLLSPVAPADNKPSSSRRSNSLNANQAGLKFQSLRNISDEHSAAKRPGKEFSPATLINQPRNALTMFFIIFG